MTEQLNRPKIYTKSGDAGFTATLGGQRNISKAHIRIEASGTLDELNSFLGFALVAIKQYTQLAELPAQIIRIQHEIFDLGAQILSTSAQMQELLPAVSENSIKALENEIDAMELQLAPLQNFILPGGSEAAARIHICRTVCRRAERVLVKLAEIIKFDNIVLVYINRLSDWLFVIARYITMLLQSQEIIWNKAKL